MGKIVKIANYLFFICISNLGLHNLKIKLNIIKIKVKKLSNQLLYNFKNWSYTKKYKNLILKIFVLKFEKPSFIC